MGLSPFLLVSLPVFNLAPVKFDAVISAKFIFASVILALVTLFPCIWPPVTVPSVRLPPVICPVIIVVELPCCYAKAVVLAPIITVERINPADRITTTASVYTLSFHLLN